MLGSALALLTLTVSPVAAPPAAALDRLRVSRATPATIALPATREPFELTLDVDGAPLTLALTPSSLRADDFRLIVDDGASRRDVPAPTPATWRGTAHRPGAAAGVVAATIADGRLRALARFEDGAILAVQPRSDVAPGAPRESHLVYAAADLVPGDETCATTEPSKAAGVGAAEPFGTVKIAEIALEADTFLFQQNGASVADTFLDVESVLNAVSVIYEGEVGLTYELTALVVQTGAQDNYGTTKHEKLLKQFRSLWNDEYDDIDRDTAHLMTGRSIETNVVGLAFVGVICEESFAYGFSETTFTGNLALRTALTAHELGHNWNASHCNGQADCSIMCATLGLCSGNIVSFGASEEADILGFKNGAVNCIEKLPTPTVAPFLDTFADNGLVHKNWSSEGGAGVSTAAWGETSGARAVNLDAAKNGQPDVLYSRGFDVTAMSDPALEFHVAHRGVEAGETLSVEYQTAAGAWLPLGQVTSDGEDQNTFAPAAFSLPGPAEHACVRFRFRANVDHKKDDWFLDDVRIVEASPAVTTALLDPAASLPIAFAFQMGDTATDDAPFEIANRGLGSASLPWTATVVEGGAFLSVSPGSGTVTAIEAADVVTVTADPTGLAPGIHHGTVRVQNGNVGADFLDLPVALMVHDGTPFVPGDSLTATIDVADEVEAGSFPALEGATVKLKVSVVDGDLQPIVRVLAEDGSQLAKLKVNGGSGKAKVKLPRTEIARLEVTGKKGSTGTCTIETSLKLPSSMALGVTKVKPAVDGADVDVPLVTLPGTVANLTVAPAKDDVGPFSVELLSPTGASRGLFPSREILPTGGVILRGVPLGGPAGYVLRVSGFAGKEKVLVTYDPTATLPAPASVDL